MKLSVVFLFILSFLTSCNTAKNIVDSNDIHEIEVYLKTSHPEDPKNQVLKSKLIALKNADWVKGAKDAKPMAARPLIVEIPKSNTKSTINSKEAEEYKTLIALTPDEHRDKTVQLLNNMFNSDVSNKEVILLLQNNSDCNMVMHLQGKKFFNLAVPAHGENSVVLPKDTYVLTSNICDVKYSSTKSLVKSQAIILSNPTIDHNSNIDNIASKNKKEAQKVKKQSSKPISTKKRKV